MFEAVQMDDVRSIQREYRRCVSQGGVEAEQFCAFLVTNMPFPQPWWLASVVEGLLFASQGQLPSLSPDEFDDLFQLELKSREVAEESIRQMFNPWQGSDGGPEYTELQQELVTLLLQYGSKGNWFISADGLVAQLLDHILGQALNAQQGDLFPVAHELRSFLARFHCDRCAKLPDHQQRSIVRLRLMADALERDVVKDVELRPLETQAVISPEVLETVRRLLEP